MDDLYNQFIQLTSSHAGKELGSCVLCCVVFSGFGMGRLCFHNQPDSAARVCAATDAALQPKSLHW